MQKAGLMLLVVICLMSVLIAGATAMEYKEAPMLEALVNEGKLEPIEDRLPLEPVVVDVEEIGQYGGRLRRFMFGSGDIWGYRGFTINEPLFYMTPDGLVPNVATGYSFSDDGLELTITLREGVRWSDGTLFTSEDIRFLWEDDWTNLDYRASAPGFTMMGDEVIEFVVIDDYTFKFVFPEPNGSLLSMIGGWYLPSNFLKQYHPWYNSDYKEYTAYGNAQNQFVTTDVPVLGPWVIQKYDETQYLLSERNPYYFKVDPTGQQLPYIDELFHFVVGDAEVAKLKIIAGEIDAQNRHLGIGDYTLLMENRDRGNYNVNLWVGSHVEPAITLNFDTPDANLREYFSKLKFRIALSIGIDREEINDVLFLGLAKPYAATFTIVSPYFDEETYDMYAYYDPDQANALLDELGLTERDRDGFRRYPDGKTVQMIIGTFAEYTNHVRVLEFVKDYWQELGVKVVVSPQARALIEEQLLSGKFDAICLATDGTDPFGRDYYWTPQTNATWRSWSVEVKEWYLTGGERGRIPFEWELSVQSTFDAGFNELNPDVRLRMGREIGRIHAMNVTAIGILAESPAPMIYKKNLRNVENGIPSGYGQAVPAAWFYAD